MKIGSPAAFASLVALVLFVNPVLAEDLTGKILDPDGRAVANASLRLYERNSGDLRTTKSSSDAGAMAVFTASSNRSNSISLIARSPKFESTRSQM